MIDLFKEFWNSTGISEILAGNWRNIVMILVAFVLFYLAIAKKFEPYLLIPIAIGMFLANFPLGGITNPPVIVDGETKEVGGLIYYLQQGVKLGIYPALIFLGIGATTDFGPLIANPKSLLLARPRKSAYSHFSRCYCLASV